MRTRTWVIVLIVVGVGLAILIGALGTVGKETQAEAQQSLCSSLGSLDTSITNLTSLDPMTASQSEYQSAVSDIQDDWNQVKADASDLHSINTSTLQGAWNSFTQAVQGVPSDASVSTALQDVSQSADQLVTTVQSTATGLNCSQT
jgi:hypothetical protein